MISRPPLATGPLPLALACLLAVFAGGRATGAQTAPILEFPSGVTLDREGNVIVADREAHAVFRIDARTSELTVIAGTGVAGWSGDGGPARSALLRAPEWVEFDAAGNLYLADRGNHVIRKIDRAGIITHVAGTGVQAQAGDGGPAATAAMTNPFGLTLDRSGNLFFFDTEVHAIRRIDARSGIVTTVIGNKQRGFGGDGGPATQAMLFRPHNGTFDRDGALIFGDSFNHRIRRWDPATGIITTIAGIGEQGTSPDGTPAGQFRFSFFGGMVVDRDGDLIFTSLDHRILELDRRTGVVRVVGGTGVAGFGGENGPVRAARFNVPYGIAIAPNGDLIIADAGNARVRRIDAATGLVRTIAGPAGWRVSAACAPSAAEHRSGGSAAARLPGLATVATGAPLWGTLAPGPHAVGFSVATVRDPGRPCQIAGAPGTQQGVPLVVSYWYPAIASAARSTLTLGAYRAADLLDDAFRHPTSRQLAAGDAARMNASPLRAIVDAPPVASSFPVIVGTGDAARNAVLAEYLASHGYVVAIVRPAIATDVPLAVRLDADARHIDVALEQLGAHSFADTARVATWGQGHHGTAAVLAAARRPAIDAVVSLEGAMFHTRLADSLRDTPLADAGALRVPLLHMLRAGESRALEEPAGFEGLRYSARIRYLLTDGTLAREPLGTFGSVAVAARSGLDRRPASQRARVATAEYVRHFLDAQLKQDERAAAWLARSADRDGPVADVARIQRRAAVAPAPSAQQFATLMRSEGSAAAMTRFHAARREDPEATLFREATINALAYQLVRGGSAPAALELFRTNTELHPRSANAWDSLSEGYEIVGDSAHAVEFARKALQVVGADSTLTPTRREEFRRIAAERIRRLGGTPE